MKRREFKQRVQHVYWAQGWRAFNLDVWTWPRTWDRWTCNRIAQRLKAANPEVADMMVNNDYYGRDWSLVWMDRQGITHVEKSRRTPLDALMVRPVIEALSRLETADWSEEA